MMYIITSWDTTIRQWCHCKLILKNILLPPPPTLPRHFKFNITLITTLCHPILPHFKLFNTHYPRITNNFQALPPPLRVTFENGIALTLTKRWRYYRWCHNVIYQCHTMYFWIWIVMNLTEAILVIKFFKKSSLMYRYVIF